MEWKISSVTTLDLPVEEKFKPFKVVSGSMTHFFRDKYLDLGPIGELICSIQHVHKVMQILQITCGSRSIIFEGARSHLLEHIKSAENLNIFKNLIKYWEGLSCGRYYCQFRNQ